MTNPLRVAPGHHTTHNYRILCVPPKQSVILLCVPAEHPPYLLHQTAHGSIACTGEDCRLCPTPTRCYGYYPVAVFRVENGIIRQEAAILPVTQTCLPPFQRFRRGNLLAVARRGNLPNGQMTITLEKESVITAIDSFNPVTQLMSLWELRRNSLLITVASRGA